MKFTHHTTVKWHDTDLNRRMRPSQMLMYLQECANLQLENAGISLDRLRDEHGLAFLLSRISLSIHEPLYTGDEIAVQTWVGAGHGISYERGFCIVKQGRVVVEATSLWGLMDLHTGRLVRADAAPYHLEPEPLPVIDLPARMPPAKAEEMECIGTRRIVYSDVDYNGHMNNTHYPDLFCDFTPDICSHRVTGVMISFLHEATYGHTLTLLRRPIEGGYRFRMQDGDTTCTDACIFLKTEGNGSSV